MIPFYACMYGNKDFFSVVCLLWICCHDSVVNRLRILRADRFETDLWWGAFYCISCADIKSVIF